MSLFISEQGTHGARVQNHSTVTHRYLNNSAPESVPSGVRVIVSRGGHKYTQVGSKGKLCCVKLAFLFH